MNPGIIIFMVGVIIFQISAIFIHTEHKETIVNLEKRIEILEGTQNGNRK